MTKNGEKNWDFVATTPGALSWEITIEPDATTGSAVTREVLTLLETLFSSFGDFIIPTTVEFDLGTIPTDATVVETITEFETVTEESITRSAGVTVENIRNAIAELEPPDGRNPHVQNIDIVDARVRLRLRDGDVEVDRSSEDVYKFWHRGEIRDEEPAMGPLSFSIRHNRTFSWEPGDDYPRTTYSIRIGTRSDIWAGDSGIAQVNRRRLASLMTNIVDELDVLDTRFHKDEFPLGREDCEILADLVGADFEVY